MQDIFETIENEIDTYLNGEVQISENQTYSQAQEAQRISYLENKVYPEGKFDSQDNYKYWFDVITPRINSEVKNIDFDTKDILIYSEAQNDAAAMFILNLFLKEEMRDTGQAMELNEDVEQSVGWGNVVWKKTEDGYERLDLTNFYVLNQTAETLENSVCIERHILTQSDLRKKKGIWQNVDEVIKECGNKEFLKFDNSFLEKSETPFYEIYERNGEISERELREAQGKSGGSEDNYVLAKVVVAGLNKTDKGDKYILYADKISKLPYREYHRSAYKGKWLREGMYLLLADIQIRANEIGNQIARGLEWAGKVIFRSVDNLIAQNVLTDMQSGDIIRAQDLEQVDVRMHNLDQLIADWNRLMTLADQLANSYEVVTGESLPSGTPFRLGGMLNVNANKLFDFIREKLGLALQSIFQDWIVPDLVRKIKAKKILQLTGDSEALDKYYEMLVDGWYISNLLRIPPHTAEQARVLKEKKIEDLKKRFSKIIVQMEKEFFINVEPRVRIVITGENINLQAELETLNSFISLETDPIRRTALIEMAMRKKGLDVASLPKTERQPEMEQKVPVKKVVSSEDKLMAMAAE